MKYKELKKIFLNKMKDNQFIIKGNEAKMILDDYVLTIDLDKSNFGKDVYIYIMVEYPSLMDKDDFKGFYYHQFLREDFESEEYCEKNILELVDKVLVEVKKNYSTKNKFEAMIKNDMDLLVRTSLPMKEFFKSMKEENQATIFKGILSKFRR